MRASSLLSTCHLAKAFVALAGHSSTQAGAFPCHLQKTLRQPLICPRRRTSPGKEGEAIVLCQRLQGPCRSERPEVPVSGLRITQLGLPLECEGTRLKEPATRTESPAVLCSAWRGRETALGCRAGQVLLCDAVNI